MSLAEKLFGSFSDRELKKINPITKKVLALETKYQPMSDAELQAQTPALKERLANGETLDDILPDAFAVCREAAWRVLGMKHFPVQIMGGIALHRGSIAEMQTGEGKTLVATLPAYLNALTGEGVHIVTVNDYLAKRDSEWMGKLYRWLGLNVGLIVQGIDGDARRRAYNADITYGTNNEYGFDYLRDNMVTYKDNMVQMCIRDRCWPIWRSSRSMSPRPVPAAGASPATPLPPWAGTRWPLIRPSAVSYTHLDVYKRQALYGIPGLMVIPRGPDLGAQVVLKRK